MIGDDGGRWIGLKRVGVGGDVVVKILALVEGLVVSFFGTTGLVSLGGWERVGCLPDFWNGNSLARRTFGSSIDREGDFSVRASLGWSGGASGVERGSLEVDDG